MSSRIENFLRTAYLPVEEESSVTSPNVATRQVAGGSALVFALGESLFGLPGAQVQEIREYLPPERLPFISNRLCIGFVALHGAAIPVLDIRLFLGLDSLSDTRTSRLIVLKSNGLETAFAVDQVHGVMIYIEDPLAHTNTPGLTIGRVHSLNRTISILDPKILGDVLEEGF